MPSTDSDIRRSRRESEAEKALSGESLYRNFRQYSSRFKGLMFQKDDWLFSYLKRFQSKKLCRDRGQDKWDKSERKRLLVFFEFETSLCLCMEWKVVIVGWRA